MKGGNIEAPWGRVEQILSQMANYYNSYNLSISGIAGDYLTAGYLDVSGLWKSGEYVYQIHNAGSAEATVIYSNWTADGKGDDVTIKLAQNQFSGKLPPIRYIKVSGTSDSLVVFTQKYAS
jgi:hypothetical protein